MYELIDKQIEIVHQNHPTERSHILSCLGGLGSSAYVQENLKKRYHLGAGGGVYGMPVLLADRPQLAVVNGLVHARMQTSKQGPEMLSLRCCPVSYGILCKRGYDPKHHKNEEVIIDPYDKSRWVSNQIDWIIEQGKVVRAEDGVTKEYTRKVPIGHENRPWHMRVVMSTLPVKSLPSSLKREGAREICRVQAILTASDMQRRNHRWWQHGKPYNMASFEVRLIVGAGLTFQIWGCDGQISHQHEELQVEWEHPDSGMAATYRETDSGDIYIEAKGRS